MTTSKNKTLLGKSAFARKVGITKGRVTALTKNQTITITDGKVDLLGTETLEYLNDRRERSEDSDEIPTIPVIPAGKPDAPPARLNPFKEKLDKAKADKLVAEARLKEIEIQKREGLLVSRKIVADTCFKYLDEMNRRLLTDMPAAISAATSELPRDEMFPIALEREIHDQVSRLMKDCVRKVSETIGAATIEGADIAAE